MVLGRYRLIDRCGAGPTSEVYRATDVRAGDTVAVRLLPQAVAGDRWYRARVDEQVQCFRRAAPHDALIPVLDVVAGAVDGRTLVVTEFVDTAPLPHVLVTGPVPFAQALDAAAQLAALLEHLHARGVLARDLRAGAVFLPKSAPDRVRVTLDALAEGPTCAPDPVPAAQSVAPHVAVAYLSPERIRGESGAAPGDIYALGALLFEMLAGRPMFLGDPEAVVQAHLQAPPPVLRQMQPTMPGALEALLMRMFAKVARFRPSAAEVRAELDAVRRATP